MKLIINTSPLSTIQKKVITNKAYPLDMLTVYLPGLFNTHTYTQVAAIRISSVHNGITASPVIYEAGSNGSAPAPPTG